MNINKYFINNLNEIIIVKLPDNINDKNKLYYDLIIFYEINMVIKYKNNIISKNELKNLIYKKEYIKNFFFFFIKSHSFQFQFL